jgi:hypothetical protein
MQLQDNVGTFLEDEEKKRKAKEEAQNQKLFDQIISDKNHGLRFNPWNQDPTPPEDEGSKALKAIGDSADQAAYEANNEGNNEGVSTLATTGDSKQTVNAFGAAPDNVKRAAEGILNSPEETEKSITRAQSDRKSGREPGKVDQFVEAISFFLPTAIGAVVGEMVGGGDRGAGAVAGAETATKLGASYRDFQFKKAQLGQDQEKIDIAKKASEAKIDQADDRIDIDRERQLTEEDRVALKYDEFKHKKKYDFAKLKADKDDLKYKTKVFEATLARKDRKLDQGDRKIDLKVTKTFNDMKNADIKLNQSQQKIDNSKAKAEKYIEIANKKTEELKRKTDIFEMKVKSGIKISNEKLKLHRKEVEQAQQKINNAKEKADRHFQLAEKESNRKVQYQKYLEKKDIALQKHRAQKRQYALSKTDLTPDYVDKNTGLPITTKGDGAGGFHFIDSNGNIVSPDKVIHKEQALAEYKNERIDERQQRGFVEKRNLKTVDSIDKFRSAADIKEGMKVQSGAASMRALLSSGKPISEEFLVSWTAKGIQRQVGTLGERDVDRAKVPLDVLNRIKSGFKEWLSGDMTSAKRAALQSLLTTVEDKQIKELREKIRGQATDFTAKSLGTDRKSYERDLMSKINVSLTSEEQDALKYIEENPNSKLSKRIRARLKRRGAL